MGVYECETCSEEFHISDSFTFGGKFRPALVAEAEGHPMYWRREA